MTAKADGQQMFLEQKYKVDGHLSKMIQLFQKENDCLKCPYLNYLHAGRCVIFSFEKMVEVLGDQTDIPAHLYPYYCVSNDSYK
jgi:hypothetical protein